MVANAGIMRVGSVIERGHMIPRYSLASTESTIQSP